MTGSLVSPVLVGRQTEAAALSDALARVASGDSATVLVSGEAGVGKSRLVHEIVGQTGAAGTRALVGTCVELDGGGIPFAPLVDMFRTLARNSSAEELAALLGAARAQIGRLVPELDDGSAGAPTGEGDASRISELILGVIERLGAAMPLMLVFEDVQWADRATLDLISLLVAGASGRRLLLVLTVRSDELHRTHPFRRMSARWEQQRAVDRIELSRLNAGEVAAQVGAIRGERPDGELVDFVFERSEGIPLFVEELLGAVRDGGLDDDYLPPSLRDVLLARAEGLSDNAQHVLRVASAAAREVPDSLLTIVSGLPEAQLSAALRETVEQQLLVVEPSGRGFGFRHSLARAAIEDDLLPGERTRLHRAYAEALEANPALGGTALDAVSMLAHHWRAAHDLARALPASVQAGRAAAAVLAPSAAQRHFELALELWTEVPDAEQRAGIDHPDLLGAAGEAAYQAGGPDRALALVDQALAEVGSGGTVERRAMLMARRAEMVRDLGREEEGIEILEQAAGMLPEGAPSEAAAHVLAVLARAMARVDRFEPARELATRAVEAAQAVGAIEDRFDAQITLGHLLVYAGEVEPGLALIQEAGAGAREAGFAWVGVRDFINRSDLLLAVGRYEEAMKAADEGMALAEELGMARTAGAFVRGNKAEALLRAGRWEEALASTELGAAAAGVFAGALLSLRAEIHALAGRQAEAQAELREATRQLRHGRAAQFALPLAGVEAELDRAAGDLDAARTTVERALARGVQGADDERYKWPMVSLGARIEAERAQAARDQGRAPPEDARDRITALLDEAEAMRTRTAADRGHLALVRAEHRRLLGGDEIDAWTETVEAVRAMNEPFPLAYALLRRAEVLSAAGASDDAAAAARESVQLARRMGAAPLLDEAEALMRRARLRIDEPSAGAPAPTAAAMPEEVERLGLTERELEVLRLVADGRSNSEIAQKLFISRKTASAHVSHILAKLGVSSRVQAAALAHRRGLISDPADA